MFSHIMVGANDVEQAKGFYDAVLGALGTVGFAVDDPTAGDAWHAAGLANGGITDEDPPGIRESAGGKMYLAYLRDPSGNKICALHRIG